MLSRPVTRPPFSTRAFPRFSHALFPDSNTILLSLVSFFFFFFSFSLFSFPFQRQVDKVEISSILNRRNELRIYCRCIQQLARKHKYSAGRRRLIVSVVINFRSRRNHSSLRSRQMTVCTDRRYSTLRHTISLWKGKKQIAIQTKFEFEF